MRRYLAIGLSCVVIAFLVFWRTTGGGQERTYRGTTMGASFAVTWMETTPHPTVPQEIEAVFLRVNRLMSTYDSNSELSAFNRSVSTDWVEVAPELADVVSIAQEVSAQTEGVFDVTVKPLVAAWGFGPEAEKGPPSEEQLASVARFVGFEHLFVRRSPPALRKAMARLQVDLNGIAPGYAADLVCKALQAAGVSNYLVDVGGELRMAGRAATGKKWEIAIANPDTSSSANTADRSVFELTDTALATSGDYRNYYEVAGKRVSHTIDPRTRRPIEHRLASVTVLAPTAAVADARATALNVWGPDVGLSRAVTNDWSVLMLVRVDGDRFETRRTGWFATGGDAD
jgi:FAD:protein FMN transferase